MTGAVRNYQARVEAINALEDEVKALSDDELRARTEAFRQQIPRRGDA